MNPLTSQFEATGEPMAQTGNLSAISHDAGMMGDVEGPSAERGEAAPADGLPCLSSNNCINKTDKANTVLGTHKRMAFIVAFEIIELAREFGLERLGFLTLTFADHVTDIREAQKRFHSIRTNVIAKRYERAIGVWERHQSGRIHFHLVVVMKSDIRTGVDFAAFDRKDYRTAKPALRAEWNFWLANADKYHFGRHELKPIKSNAEGIARYVGKYISKHITQRLPQDRGARVVRFIGFKPGMRKASLKFSWATANGWLWRRKTAQFAQRFGITNLEQMRRHFGPRWAYHLQDTICSERLKDTVYPCRTAYERGACQSDRMLVAQVQARQIMNERPATQTRLSDNRQMDDSPVWAVPRWFGEKAANTPPHPEAITEAEERAREMRLYALRLPPVEEQGKPKRWD
jgi:hypothetical protein